MASDTPSAFNEERYHVARYDMQDAWRKEQMEVNAQEKYLMFPCDCQLFPDDNRMATDLNNETVPVPLAFSAQLREAIARSLPMSYPLSLLLIHVTQWEQTPVSITGTIPTRRQRFHAPPGLLDQVLTNVRRVIRAGDRILVQPDIAAALVLPYVDEKGIESIHDRIYHSVSLLQAETVIPPLRREVTIEFGFSTSSSALETSEEMLTRACRLVSQFSLTPVMQVPSWLDGESASAHCMPAVRLVEPCRLPDTEIGGRFQGIRETQAPFMHLPARLPERLTQLIPYAVATSLRCVPVGRNHNRLTVAMADPGDIQALSQLAEITGMTIFPVACEEEALDRLLAYRW
jgi:hypothetical protein